MNAISQTILAAPVVFTISWWIKVREFLLEAIERLDGTHTEEDIIAMLLAGRAGLWVNGAGAAITEIVQNGRIKEVNVLLAGGKMDDIVAMKPSLERHAQEMNCDRIVIRGRKGWERVHPDYRMSGIALCKDL